MADDPTSGDDSGEPSEYDRMSLNSLKRELERSKAQTEMAREEARDRIDESQKPKRPIGVVIGIIAALVLVIGGLFYLGQKMLPPMREWDLPGFVAEEWDAGQFADPSSMVARPRPDAGPPDAGRRRRRPRRPHKNRRPGLGLDGLGGNDSDPLRGVD